MKVKKYVVDSLPQAMGQIKNELGNDAMIIQTKKIKTGGVFGLFGKQKIEVIAAADNKPKSNQYNSKSNNETYKNNSYSRNAYNNPVTSQSSQPKVEINNTNNKSINSEVAELKQLMVKMMMNQDDTGNPSSYKKQLKTIHDHLVAQGINKDIVSEIIEKVINYTEETNDSNILLQEVKKELINRFKKNGNFRDIKTTTKLIHFVGPTGVGKTTTIAKLAAEKVLKYNKRIAFITADTYRIGAVEQLRTYAEILHAPIEVVFTPQDTQKAIEKFSNYDLIFMDTAGRNYHNEMYISELNNILAKSYNSETFLVLSLTHKYEDMVSILDQFKKVNINKILFTKFDETLTFGSIINILSTYPYDLSYITNGQNVPDDIELFNDEKVANAILGG